MPAWAAATEFPEPSARSLDSTPAARRRGYDADRSSRPVAHRAGYRRGRRGASSVAPAARSAGLPLRAAAAADLEISPRGFAVFHPRPVARWSGVSTSRLVRRGGTSSPQAARPQRIERQCAEQGATRQRHLDERRASERAARLDGLPPGLSRLSPSLRVRRLHGFLPKPAIRRRRQRLRCQRNHLPEKPPRVQHHRLRLQQQRTLPRTPVGHEVDGRHPQLVHVL